MKSHQNELCDDREQRDGGTTMEVGEVEEEDATIRGPSACYTGSDLIFGLARRTIGRCRKRWGQDRAVELDVSLAPL